jgi:hypothetical protein
MQEYVRGNFIAKLKKAQQVFGGDYGWAAN